MPLTLKPEPVTAIWEITAFVPPVLVMVDDSELEFPTVTLPKLRLEGVAVRRPSGIAVPERGKAREGLDALEETVTRPVRLPPY